MSRLDFPGSGRFTVIRSAEAQEGREAVDPASRRTIGRGGWALGTGDETGDASERSRIRRGQLPVDNFRRALGRQLVCGLNPAHVDAAMALLAPNTSNFRADSVSGDIRSREQRALFIYECLP
jgi:hypothetical protein